ncbi:MAG: peptide deformylase [Proteobacteria bacterium]|nr:peptide deformylase [Pseudomonadota bacterium]
MLKMHLCGDPILREVATPVETIDDDLRRVLAEMVKIMDRQKGAGLAAPQVGILKRFIVMRDPGTNELFKMINPKITARSDGKIIMEEGCLSVLGPDDMPVFADVARPSTVEIVWTDEHGAPQTAEFSGNVARIVQHEYDHLDGILFIDYLSSVKREMVMRKVKKRK